MNTTRTRVSPAAPAASDLAGRPLATWPTRHPWWWAVGIGLAGTLLTAFGVAYGQARELDLLASTWAQAAFVAASALLGLLVMARTRPTLADYGFRRPTHLRTALWALPLAVVPVVVALTAPFDVTPAQALAYVAVTIAVGVNEEIWFRGLLLAALRRLGARTAVVGAAAVFGALHLTNFFAGSPPLYLALQFAFACIVGFVLAELVAISGSLWIPIAWHFVHDLVSFSTGDAYTGTALVGTIAITVVLLTYAVWLWRRLPTDDRRGLGG